MPRVIFEPERGQRVPVLLWAREASRATVRQLQSIASQPYVTRHVAAMPDAHVAEGVAVGTVFSTQNTIVPGALGGDLGCGMCALHFPAPAAALGPAELRALLAALARVVPVGDATHREGARGLPDSLSGQPLSTRSLSRIRDSLGPRHMGTLGGGNHFLELDRDASGDLWVLVHSGSRGVGSAVARHHRAALDSMRNPLKPVQADSDAGRAYLTDAGFALAFARANRDAILARAVDVVTEVLGVEPEGASHIDVHHNFVARECHGGEDLWVHRKGATPAGAGEHGIIPGSMATATYLVRGKGSAESFGSCSHGAGRVLSRREARERIDSAALVRSMRRVVFERERADTLVEEAPEAYRDIGTVLEDQEDLVEPVLRLEPIAVLKG